MKLEADDSIRKNDSQNNQANIMNFKKAALKMAAESPTLRAMRLRLLHIKFELMGTTLPLVAQVQLHHCMLL